jgi:hypothetical protein
VAFSNEEPPSVLLILEVASTERKRGTVEQIIEGIIKTAAKDIINEGIERMVLKSDTKVLKQNFNFDKVEFLIVYMFVCLYMCLRKVFVSSPNHN